MANACVFCGDDSARLTDEHVFADWISEFFKKHLGVHFDGVSQLVDESGRVTQYPMVPFQQEVKIVCQGCNGGWMRRMEDSVQPILKPMMLGERTRVRAGPQKRLASWAAKTALVLDHLHPAARVVPDSHYGRFRTHLMGSSLVAIRIFTVIPYACLTRRGQHPRGLTPRRSSSGGDASARSPRPWTRSPESPPWSPRSTASSTCQGKLHLRDLTTQSGQHAC